MSMEDIKARQLAETALHRAAEAQSRAEQATGAGEMASRALQTARSARSSLGLARDAAEVACGMFLTENAAINADERFSVPEKLYLTNAGAANVPVSPPLFFSVELDDAGENARQFAWSIDGDGPWYRHSGIAETAPPGSDMLEFRAVPEGSAEIYGIFMVAASGTAMSGLFTPGSFVAETNASSRLRGEIRFTMAGFVRGSVTVNAVTVAEVEDSVAVLTRGTVSTEKGVLRIRDIYLDDGFLALTVQYDWGLAMSWKPWSRLAGAQELNALARDVEDIRETAQSAMGRFRVVDAPLAADALTAPDKIVLVSSQAQGFPVAAPLYCEVKTSQDDACVTQDCWQVDAPQKYSRVFSDGRWSDWAVLGAAPDGITVLFNEDGRLCVPQATAERFGLVRLASAAEVQQKFGSGAVTAEVLADASEEARGLVTLAAAREVQTGMGSGVVTPAVLPDASAELRGLVRLAGPEDIEEARGTGAVTAQYLVDAAETARGLVRLASARDVQNGEGQGAVTPVTLPDAEIELRGLVRLASPEDIEARQGCGVVTAALLPENAAAPDNLTIRYNDENKLSVTPYATLRQEGTATVVTLGYDTDPAVSVTPSVHLEVVSQSLSEMVEKKTTLVIRPTADITVTWRHTDGEPVWLTTATADHIRAGGSAVVLVHQVDGRCLLTLLYLGEGEGGEDPGPGPEPTPRRKLLLYGGVNSKRVWFGDSLQTLRLYAPHTLNSFSFSPEGNIFFTTGATVYYGPDMNSLQQISHPNTSWTQSVWKPDGTLVLYGTVSGQRSIAYGKGVQFSQLTVKTAPYLYSLKLNPYDGVIYATANDGYVYYGSDPGNLRASTVNFGSNYASLSFGKNGMIYYGKSGIAGASRLLYGTNINALVEARGIVHVYNVVEIPDGSLAIAGHNGVSSSYGLYHGTNVNSMTYRKYSSDSTTNIVRQSDGTLIMGGKTAVFTGTQAASLATNTSITGGATVSSVSLWESA